MFKNTLPFFDFLNNGTDLFGVQYGICSTLPFSDTRYENNGIEAVGTISGSNIGQYFKFSGDNRVVANVGIGMPLDSHNSQFPNNVNFSM